MSEFRMPSLGADMDAGTVLEWRVAPGAQVHRGDVVLLVDTDKAEIEVEIWEDGVVERILVEPGEKVPVGAVLATLRASGEAQGARAPEIGAAPEPPRRPEAEAQPVQPAAISPPVVARAPAPSPAPPRAPTPPPGPARERPRATPLARRIAADLGVDLRSVAGTGVGGAIVADDVQRAAATKVAPAVAPAPQREAFRPPAALPAPRAAGASERQAAIRRRIAAAMERSKREIPHYYLETQCDVGRALAWLASENAQRPLPERLLLAPLLLKAVALAAAAAPELNGHWIADGFRPGGGVHIGVVVSLRGGGLLVPTLRDADRKSVAALMAELRDATQRARRGTLRGADVSEATLTITNLGETGVETVFGAIFPPQVALVGFGRVTERPWAEGGLLGVRPVLTATLSADHRASDGQRGARFLSAIARALAQPEAL